MKRALALLVIVFFFASAAYGGGTFDATNDKTIGISMQKMMIGLSPIKQKKLHESIASLYMVEALKAMGKMSTQEVQKHVGKKLHGKTADQIIKMAEKVKMNLNMNMPQ